MHAACIVVTRHLLPPDPYTSPCTVCSPFDSRQGTSAFNQPLSFDTSSVTNMHRMFDVRSSPCPVPYLQSSPHLHAACAAIARRLPPLPARTSPRTVCPPFDSRQRAYSLSDANKLLVRCAWAGTSAFATAGYGSSWGPGTCPATFTTKASLKTAVEAYNANPTTAIATYGPIADWGVSGITDMGGLFYNLKNFDADVSNWDTSGVTDMSSMFQVRSTPVLPPICSRTSTARWTPSPLSVGLHPRPHRTVCPPFGSRQGASAFNQPLSFDTSSVTTMYAMFKVRSSPCPAPNLQSSLLPCTLRLRRGRPPPPASRPAPRPASYALPSTLGSTRQSSTSR